MSISWSNSVPLKVKARADLYHRLLELYKKGAEIASYTPLLWFDLQHLRVLKYITVLAENMPVPVGSRKISPLSKQCPSHLAGVTPQVEPGKCEVPVYEYFGLHHFNKK